MQRIQRWPILSLTALFIVSLAIKSLLIPAYYSTDFDVHQNWLRITSNKPMTEWYFDSESKWTLDYPPLFAYFEWVMAQIANAINPSITAVPLNLSQTINQDQSTILFQRISVILSQIPFLLVLYLVIGQINFKLIAAYFSIPFLILDNIHFQYNIIMQAIFVLCVYFIQKQRYLAGAFTYACLLNFKHIYLYAGLAFFAYILKNYVLKPQSNVEKLTNLIKVGVVTLIPFCISFLPFVAEGGIQQLQQIFSRLFPFQRGLIHQYWAPNFWALYFFLDKIINIVSNKFLGYRSINFKQVSGDLHQLKILPQVTPLITTLIILIVSLPILIAFFRKNIAFHRLVFICGTIFFLFGFHVHQKAITPYLSLLLIFASPLPKDRNNSLYINAAILVNIVNLLPLLIDSNEKILRLALPLVWIAIWDSQKQIESNFQIIICTISITLVFYHQIFHGIIASKVLQFLPLMLNSVFAASFNICWVFLLYYRQVTTKQTEQLSKGEYAAVETSQD